MANADTLDGAGVNSGNALPAAKVQQNSETMKFYYYFLSFLNLGGQRSLAFPFQWPFLSLGSQRSYYLFVRAMRVYQNKGF